MKYLTLVSTALLLLFTKPTCGQHHDLNKIIMPESAENIFVKPLFHDSLSSGFVIFIKEKVKIHTHLKHSEQVIILEGEGMMTLGDSTFTIKPNDVIYIPKGTKHGVVVTSKTPMKIHSTQSPYFDGSDRVFVE